MMNMFTCPAPVQERQLRFNQYLLTFLLCAVPGALLVVMVYRWFRRDGAMPRTALLLAGARNLVVAPPRRRRAAPAPHRT